jgi:regulator of cell morphogenesis and NO signaling
VLLSVLPVYADLVDAPFDSLEAHSRADATAALASQRAVCQISKLRPCPIESKVTREPALAQAVADAPKVTNALISYIQHRYQACHRSDLVELTNLVSQVELQCGDKPCAPRMIMNLLCGFSDLLAAQTEQDNRVLFPMMVSAAHPKMTGLIRRIMIDHGILRDLLVELHHTVDGPAPSVAAGPTWTALCFGAREFADDLVTHLHLKEAVLFPRFL